MTEHLTPEERDERRNEFMRRINTALRGVIEDMDMETSDVTLVMAIMMKCPNEGCDGSDEFVAIMSANRESLMKDKEFRRSLLKWACVTNLAALEDDIEKSILDNLMEGFRHQN